VVSINAIMIRLNGPVQFDVGERPERGNDSWQNQLRGFQLPQLRKYLAISCDEDTWTWIITSAVRQDNMCLVLPATSSETAELLSALFIVSMATHFMHASFPSLKRM
jgi:hypothetical protein